MKKLICASSVSAVCNKCAYGMSVYVAFACIHAFAPDCVHPYLRITSAGDGKQSIVQVTH